MSIPSEVLADQAFKERVFRENLEEKQRIINNMQSKIIEIQKHVEKESNPNPLVVISVTILILAVIWLLYILFVKISFSGDWVSADGKNVLNFNHNKFTDNVTITSKDKYGNLKLDDITYTKSNNGLIKFNDKVPYLIYDYDTMMFYCVNYAFTDRTGSSFSKVTTILPK